MNDTKHLPVVGIVGGIGSGKSSIARDVASRRNVLLVDADSLGHDVLRQETVINSLRQRFGDEILDNENNISRGALARLVFGDTEDCRQNRADLESIVHPEIGKEIRKRIDNARENSALQAVLLDAAVLFEAGWNQTCDAVVFVDTSESERIRRVQENRTWTADELRRRECSQLPIEEKRRRATMVIDNSGSLDAAASQFETFLDNRISN